MFGPRHYVPILRWKRAERVALRMLKGEHRALLTPLLELTPRSFAPRKTKKNELKIPDPNQVLADAADDMCASWGQAPFFVDLCHLNPVPKTRGGTHPLVVLAERAQIWRLALIPVTGLHRTDDYQRAVSSVVNSNSCGVCVRLRPADIESCTLDADLRALLRGLSLEKTQADLLLDCRVWTGETTDFSGLVSLIPDTRAWRTLTIASGAFPRFLTGMAPGQHFLDRGDWLAWCAHTAARSKLSRIASYSDYTIQHADFSEPPEGGNFSASIRYTIEHHWLIMRGEAVFKENGPGFDQWPANAQLLREHEEFRGRDFSYGDQYIFEIGGQSAKTGNPETWLRAGINHHMTFVARQVANLPGL